MNLSKPPDRGPGPHQLPPGLNQTPNQQPNPTHGVIRPAGRKEVTVSIKGLDFNTPDTFVFEYRGKFGKAARYNQLLELMICYVEVSCCLVLHPSLLHTDSVVRCCYKRLCNVDMRQ